MKQTWAKLGGQLGIGCVAVGLLLIGVAWNGAASVDFVSGQVPYLLSGGFLGLSLVLLGMGLVVVQNSRRDRAMLEAQLKDLNNQIARLANAVGGGMGATNGSALANLGPDMVVVGNTSFHRPDCRLATGKHLAAMSIEGAVSEGLSPCRICNPTDESADSDGAAEMTEERRSRRPRRRSSASN
jgi:hypothetical protein